MIARGKTRTTHSMFLGWPMVALTFCLAIATQGFGIYHFSMLKSLIGQTAGSTATEVAFAYSFYAVSMAVAGLFVGNAIERIGIRKVLAASAVLYGGGFFLLSFANSLPMLYATYIIMGIGSSCGGVVVITGIPSNWFVKHRGTANGIIWSATFVGSLFVTNFIAIATASGPWQNAVRILGVIAFAIILIVSAFLVWRPQDKNQLPDGIALEEAADESEQAGSAKIVGLTRTKALRTRTFWILAVAIFLTGIGEMGVFQNMATFIVSTGNPLSTAAACMSLIGLIGFFGKNLSGFCIDKLGVRATYFVIEIVATAGLVMLAFAGPELNLAYTYVAIALFGIGENAAIVCFSACTGKYLGIKHYAQIFGCIFLAKALDDAAGSPLVAAIAESGLGWSGAFIIAAIACMVSAFVFFGARKEPSLVAMERKAAAELEQELRKEARPASNAHTAQAHA